MTSRRLAKTPKRRSARKWLLVVGLLIVILGILPAWRQASLWYHLGQAREGLVNSEFDRALDSLVVAERIAPRKPEIQYLMAVAKRRTGQLDEVERRLKSAEELGWAVDDIRRQRLLLQAQVGGFKQVEDELKGFFEKGVSDEAALEIYEALAIGYTSSHRIKDALQCLDFWIKWRPQDVHPRLMRADIYVAYNDPVSAEKDYRAILQSDPDHHLSRALLAKLLLEKGRVDDAAKEFLYCVEQSHRTATVLAGLAECELRSSRPEKAQHWLDQIDYEELPPEERARVLKLGADLARFNREHERAVELLTETIEFWPHDSGVHQSLGQSYAALGKKELAKRHLDISREISERGERYFELQREVVKQPNNPDLRAEIGDVLMLQGLDEDAAGWWQSALRYDPHHQASHEGLVRYLTAHGKTQLANQHRQAAAVAAESSFRRGWAALQDRNLQQARREQKNLARFKHSGSLAQVLVVGLLNKQGKFDEAQAQLPELLANTALRPWALTLQGESLVGQGRPLEAEPLFQEALTLNPQMIDAHRWLATVYYDLGAVNQAETHLLRTAELDASDYRPHRILGLMNKDYEIFDAAIQCYQESLRRNPRQPPREEVLLELAECQIKQRDFDAALTTLADAQPSLEQMVLRAECFYNTRRTEEAVKLLDQVLGQAPLNYRALLLRGDAALVAEEPERARRLLRRAVDQKPYDHDAHQKLSQALTRLDQQEAARKHLDRAEELKKLRQRFAELHKQAFAKPYDAPLRRELARVAELMGRSDLMDVWIKAAEALEASPSSSQDEQPSSQESGDPHSQQ